MEGEQLFAYTEIKAHAGKMNNAYKRHIGKDEGRRGSCTGNGGRDT